MQTGLKSKTIHIGGMTCQNCQNLIQKKLYHTAGITKATVSYHKGTAEIDYDTDIISLKDVYALIERMEYQVLEESQKPDSRKMMGVLLILLAIYTVAKQWGFTEVFNLFPVAEAGMSYGALLLLGLFTSVHCIAMCGGINLSQCMHESCENQGKSCLKTAQPSMLYNLGRVVSYTAMGALVGGIGSVVSFSGGLQGMVQLIAGVFMVIMGINMLGIFPQLKHFSIHLPNFLFEKVDTAATTRKSPFYVGLLNGLMPCGPLQAMQLYALSTGSPIAGAFSMFLFGIGTVPLMFGLGTVSSLLSKNFTKKAMSVGAVLVVLLGISMFSQGWSLSGFGYPSFIGQGGFSNETAQESTVAIENGVQVVHSTLSPGRYPAITVQSSMPVKWVIDAPQGSINGCNNRIYIKKYGIEHSFQTGQNIIEFFPVETGNFTYSCWMGMIRSSITVVEGN